jgi:hypothetical protein
MRRWAGLLVAVGVVAQEPAPPSLVRGTLLEWDVSSSTGELSLRVRDYHVYCFWYDSQTRFERDSQPASVAQLRKGDVLEIVAEAGPNSVRRYARLVRLLASSPPAAPPVYRPSYRPFRGLADDLFPRGSLTLAGVVSQLSEERLILRTRADPAKRILLRTDTRYLEDGCPVALSALRVNTRIFVRAGENLEGEIEAYQVVWGEILKPGP